MNQLEIKMIITLSPATGQINVSGIPDNKLVAFGMLKLAEVSMAEYFKAAEQRLVQPAPLMPRI